MLFFFAGPELIHNPDFQKRGQQASNKKTVERCGIVKKKQDFKPIWIYTKVVIVII